jgi:hypothetical protein
MSNDDWYPRILITTAASEEVTVTTCMALLRPDTRSTPMHVSSHPFNNLEKCYYFPFCTDKGKDLEKFRNP